MGRYPPPWLLDNGYAQVGWGKKGLNAFDFKGQFEVVALGHMDILDLMDFVDIINHSPPAVPPYCCHKDTCKHKIDTFLHQETLMIYALYKQMTICSLCII